MSVHHEEIYCQPVVKIKEEMEKQIEQSVKSPQRQRTFTDEIFSKEIKSLIQRLEQQQDAEHQGKGSNERRNTHAEGATKLPRKHNEISVQDVSFLMDEMSKGPNKIPS